MVDETSKKLVYGAVKEEEILNLNVSSELVLCFATQTMSLMPHRRRRAARTSTTVQSRYGRVVHIVPGIVRGRLSDGRLRGGPIQKGILGVDFMLVGW